MADLKQQLAIAGFGAVRTYIQSGNILLESDIKKEILREKIHQLILNHFGLDIEIFVMTRETVKKALDESPFPPEAAPNRVFITFLSEPPATEKVIQLSQLDLGEEQYILNGKILYFHLPDGMANSKMSNVFFEQKLKVKSTGRNLNTIQKLLALV